MEARSDRAGFSKPEVQSASSLSVLARGIVPWSQALANPLPPLACSFVQCHRGCLFAESDDKTTDHPWTATKYRRSPTAQRILTALSSVRPSPLSKSRPGGGTWVKVCPQGDIGGKGFTRDRSSSLTAASEGDESHFTLPRTACTLIRLDN